MTARRIIPLLPLLVTLCGAQPETNIVWPLSLTRLGVSSWGSAGTGVAEAGLPDAPLTNPAALHTEGIVLYAEGARRFRTEYLFDLALDETDALPAYVCLSAGAGPFTAAAGYAETYDHRLTSGPVEVTTVENPDGTGEFFTVENRRRVAMLFGALSYRFSDRLSAGVTVHYHSASLKDKLWRAVVEAHGEGWGGTAGILMQVLNALHVGVSASFGERIAVPYSPLFGLITIHDPVMGGNGRITAVSVSPRLYARLPVIVRAGVMMELTPSLAFLYAVEHAGWAAVSSYGDTYDVSAGVRIIAAPWLTLRAGLHHHPHPPVPPSTYALVNGQFDQDLFTAGAEVAVINHVRLSAAVTRCFLSTTKDFGQGDVMAGVQYSL